MLVSRPTHNLQANVYLVQWLNLCFRLWLVIGASPLCTLPRHQKNSLPVKLMSQYPCDSISSILVLAHAAEKRNGAEKKPRIRKRFFCKASYLIHMEIYFFKTGKNSNRKRRSENYPVSHVDPLYKPSVLGMHCEWHLETESPFNQTCDEVHMEKRMLLLCYRSLYRSLYFSCPPEWKGEYCEIRHYDTSRG